ncbi:14062_t:CDS:2, partial [Racocetra persica]
LKDVDMGTILEILTEGDVFLLEELSSQVVQYLYSDIDRFIGKDMVTLVEFIIDHNIFKQKFESLFYDIVKDIKILVFDTNEMFNIETLEYLIRYDKLGITENLLWKEHETINKDILEDVLRSKLNPSWYIPKYGTLKTIFSYIFHIKQIFVRIKIFKKMSGKDLYNFCEEKKSLLILGRKRLSSYIVGWHNDNLWDRGIVNTTNSFIFHIDMYDGVKVATPKENNNNCRINTDYGPTFGSGDLRIDGYNWTYEINSYNSDFTSGTHEMEFVEVYQIKKTNKFI